MKTTEKYRLPGPGSRGMVEIPRDAELVGLEWLSGEVWAFFVIDPDAPRVPQLFQTIGTGTEVPNTDGAYWWALGTVFEPIIDGDTGRRGHYVWHVFTTWPKRAVTDG